MTTLLRPKQVQEILGCSKETVYRLFNNKFFPSMRIGKNWYISQKALDKWLEMYEYKDYALD